VAHRADGAGAIRVIGRNAAPRAAELAQRSLTIAEPLGDAWLIAWTVHLLGLTAYIGGDYATANAHYERCLAMRRELGHLEGLLIVLLLKAMAAFRLGQSTEALALTREALDIARQLNSTWFFSSALPIFASLAAEQQPQRAARLGGAVTAMSESAQTLPIPITVALFDEGMRIAQRKLGEVAFGAAWAEGRAMSMDSVLADAQAVEVLPRSDSPARLTPTVSRSAAATVPRPHHPPDRGGAGGCRLDDRPPHHAHL